MVWTCDLKCTFLCGNKKCCEKILEILPLWRFVASLWRILAMRANFPRSIHNINFLPLEEGSCQISRSKHVKCKLSNYFSLFLGKFWNSAAKFFCIDSENLLQKKLKNAKVITSLAKLVDAKTWTEDWP